MLHRHLHHICRLGLGQPHPRFDQLQALHSINNSTIGWYPLATLQVRLNNYRGNRDPLGLRLCLLCIKVVDRLVGTTSSGLHKESIRHVGSSCTNRACETSKRDSENMTCSNHGNISTCNSERWSTTDIDTLQGHLVPSVRRMDRLQRLSNNHTSISTNLSTNTNTRPNIHSTHSINTSTSNRSWVSMQVTIDNLIQV